MNLSEFQAKRILDRIGVTVPRGEVCTSVETAEALALSLGEPPWIVKAQIPAGGRAKGHFQGDPQARGGVRKADTAAQLTSHVRQMLGGRLITRQTGPEGALVSSVYIEECIDKTTECYLALTIEPASGNLAFVVSPKGGVNIEEVAKLEQDAIRRYQVDIDKPFDAGEGIADWLQVTGDSRDALIPMLESLRQVFIDKDMSLLEINPLTFDKSGLPVALDATIVFDDNALFRQGHEEQLVAYEDLPDAEYRAAAQGLNFVRLDGDIAMIAAGAGLAMATLDAIHDCGGAPANFLEVAPSTSSHDFVNALRVLADIPDVKCILVNVFGGGIMRCDAVADAILIANNESPFNVPLVVRLAGTNATLATQRLSTSMPEAILARDLGDAAARAVALPATGAGSGNAASSSDETVPFWKKLIGRIPDKA